MTSAAPALSTRAKLVALLLVAVLAVMTALAPVADAAFPGRNGRLVFERDGRIASAPGTGGAVKLHAKYLTQAPTWSKDGKWIAYLKHEAGTMNFEVWIMKADGSGKRRVVPAGYIDGVSFAPNGSLLYSEFNMGLGGSVLMRVNRDGSGKRRVLGKLKGTITSGRFSPDGSRLAITFSGDGSGVYGLYVVKPDGSGLRRVSAAGQSVDKHDWAPSGKALVYGVGYQDLWRVRVDGAGRKRLADGTQRKNFSHPAWSPNGRRIAYTMNNDIWTMAADGSNKVRVIGGTANDAAPSWQPK